MPMTHRQHGTAMMETVLVLPLVFVILALLFFFGQSMTRLQRSSVTDRYEAWRQTQYGPGPGAEFGKLPSEFGDADLLNQAFFAGNASELDVEDRAGRINVSEPTDIVASAAMSIASPSDIPAYSPDVAGEMIEQRILHSPAWWRVGLATEHTSDVPFYQRFAGPIRHQHTVIDGDWSNGSWIEQLNRGDREILHNTLLDDVYFDGDDDLYDGDDYIDLDELTPSGVAGVYETFYSEFDTVFEQMQEQSDNPLARRIRVLYLGLGVYRGPQVLPELPYYIYVYRSRADAPRSGQ